MSTSSKYFDRFDNADEARAIADSVDQTEREERAEAIELYGEARRLFDARHQDTFTIEKHGREIEFYYPVDVSDVNLDALSREAARDLKRRTELLGQFEERQARLIESAQSGEGVLGKLYEESMEATDLACEILSAFAVDESYDDPRVWHTIFPNEDRLSDVFRGFINEGEPDQTQAVLGSLENLESDSSSPS